MKTEQLVHEIRRLKIEHVSDLPNYGKRMRVYTNCIYKLLSLCRIRIWVYYVFNGRSVSARVELHRDCVRTLGVIVLRVQDSMFARRQITRQ